MKFWENGFFENQNAEQSRKWISDERWQELLDGQSSGYEIFTNENREPDLREWQLTIEQSLTEEYHQILAWFEEYDNQAKQYSRTQRMGKEFDKNMASLDSAAVIKSARIKIIRENLNILN